MKEECSMLLELCYPKNKLRQTDQETISKIQKFDKELLVFAAVLMILVQSFQNSNFLYLLILLSVSIFLSQRYKNLFFELSAFFYLYLVIEENLFLEVLGGLLPSFLFEFYIWNKIEIFLILGVIKLLLIPQKVLKLGLLSLLMYSLLDLILRKNLRKLLSKTTKNMTNSKYISQLWMDIQYPIVLVSQKLIIKKCNHSFLQQFKGKNKLEDVFHSKNLEVIKKMIKNSFENTSAEKHFIKEKNKNWLIFVRILNWKAERCSELSIVELSEETYNEIIFSDFSSNQSNIISDFEKLLLSSYKGKDADSELLIVFHQMCVGFWSHQLFLEQQIDYLSASDLKKIDFCAELSNTVEILFSKFNRKGLSFQTNFMIRKLAVFTHAIRLKVFLFGILDFCINKAIDDSSISITLKESEPNQNSSSQNLSIEYFSPDFNAQEINSLLFVKKQKIDEFEKTTKIFSFLYSIIPYLVQALGIDFKPVTQKEFLIKLEFILNFRQIDVSNKAHPQKLVWQNSDKRKESIKNSLKISHQHFLTILPRLSISFEYKSSSKNSNSCSFSKLMPNVLNPRSFSNIAAISTVPYFKRSFPGVKVRKSRGNRNKPPDYAMTRKQKIKRFYYQESLKSLNFEIGVFKVLIVDDFNEGRRVIQGLLKEIFSISCEFAKDGIGAVEMFEGYASQGFMYQIIFMDLIMPKMTGFEASAKIREIEKNKEYPKTFICAVSGDTSCYEKVAKYEIDDVGKYYIAIKPLDISKIETIVRRARVVLDNR